MLRRYWKFAVVSFALVLLGLGGLGWYAYLHYTDPETVRRLVIEHAEQAFPGARVEIESASVRLLGWLRLRNLVVSEPTEEGSYREFLHLSEVLVYPDHNRLLEGKLEIHKAVFAEPKLSLRRDAAGQWNISRWIGKKPIEIRYASQIEINDGVVHLEFAKSDVSSVELTGMNVSVQIRPPAKLSWQAGVSHACVERLSVEGQGDLATKDFHLEASTTRPLDLAKLHEHLPPSWKERLRGVEELGGLVDLKMAADFSQAEQNLDGRLKLTGSIRECMLTHSSLPYPIRKAQGNFAVSPEGLEFSRLQFEFGPARCKLAGSVPGWVPEDLELEGFVLGLPFSEELYVVLPPNAKKFWQKFLPEGAFDLHGKVRIVEGRVRFEGAVDLAENAMTFHQVPYRVHRIAGRLLFHPNGSITVEGQGLAGNGPVFAQGSLSDLSPTSKLDFTIHGQGIVADQQFRDALPPEVRKVIDEFVGSGRGDFVATIRRPKGQLKPEVNFEVDLDLDTCRCSWFPYPLQDVTGHISITPYRCEFRNLKGMSGDATVFVNGRSVRTTDGAHVELKVQGKKVPLDSKLLFAFPEGFKGVWKYIQPSGRIDLDCLVVKAPDSPIDIRLTIDPTGSSIVLASFPYRLDDLQGVIEYQQERVTWDSITARHGNVRLICSGICDFGGVEKVVQLTSQRPDVDYGLFCPGLLLDADLRRALPSELKEVAEFLDPDRPVWLKLRNFVFYIPKDDSQPMGYEFDGTVRFRETNLIPSVGAQNVTGTISLNGFGRGEDRQILGNIDLGSITVAGFTATDVYCRLENPPLDPNGFVVPRATAQDLQLENIRGNLYSGELHGTLLANFGEVPAYECRLHCSKSRLISYMRENWPKAALADGLVEGDLYLRGRGEDIGKLGGRGRINIRRADVYRLPVIFDLLDALSLQVPDGQVFDEVETDFQLDDRILFFDNLNLTGQSLSFFLIDPPGRLNLDSADIDLRLGFRWKKDRWQIPLINDVLKTAADQLITVRLKGKLPNVTPVPEPVPVIRKILEAPNQPSPGPAADFRKLFEAPWRFFAPNRTPKLQNGADRR